MKAPLNLTLQKLQLQSHQYNPCNPVVHEVLKDLMKTLGNLFYSD